MEEYLREVAARKIVACLSMIISSFLINAFMRDWKNRGASSSAGRIKNRAYSPERPPDVEAHRVQPEEGSQEEEVRHDR